MSCSADPIVVTADSYEAHASEYASYRADRSSIRPRIDRFAELAKPGGAVLDIGCGPGVDTATLAQAGLRAVPMDIAAAMTRLATRYVPGSTVRADSRNLPFTSNSFDAVWANASLLHLPKEAVGVCVLEILRVLSPGGIFFAAMQVGSDNAIESNRPGASFAAPRFFARYELDEWVACIEGPGFEVIESRATASWIHTFARKP